jgi:hypothetical protein
VITDEARQQYESLCENFMRRFERFTPRMSRFRFIAWLQESLAWFNIPVCIANTLLFFNTGRGSDLLFYVMLGDALIITLAAIYRAIVHKRLCQECEELDCAASMLTDFLRHNPELAKTGHLVRLARD